jgi:hypothetical protein
MGLGIREGPKVPAKSGSSSSYSQLEEDAEEK